MKMRPLPEQIDAIRFWLLPRERRELQSFLGTANYYSDFINNNLTKTKHLTDTNRSTTTSILTEKNQIGFIILQRQLCSTYALPLIDGEKAFYLDDFASVIAISGVLQQEQT